jgi:hypothetical protein
VTARRKPRRGRSSIVAAEVCEERVLLSATAPNVFASCTGVVGDRYLRINAQGNGNHFSITSLANGDLQVTGLNGTLINGGTAPFVATQVSCSERIVVNGINNVVTIGTEGGPRTILPAKLFVGLNGETATGPNTLIIANTTIEKGNTGFLSQQGSLQVEAYPADTITVYPDVVVDGFIDLTKPVI